MATRRRDKSFVDDKNNDSWPSNRERCEKERKSRMILMTVPRVNFLLYFRMDFVRCDFSSCQCVISFFFFFLPLDRIKSCEDTVSSKQVQYFHSTVYSFHFMIQQHRRRQIDKYIDRFRFTYTQKFTSTTFHKYMMYTFDICFTCSCTYVFILILPYNFSFYFFYISDFRRFRTVYIHIICLVSV